MGNKFTLRLYATESIDYIEECFKQKLRRIKFPAKTPWKHISISGVVLRGSKDLLFLRYYDALEWESKFTLGLNVTKNIYYIEKWVKQKLHRLKFPKNKLSGSTPLSTPGMELVGSKELLFLRYYNALEWENKFTLGLKATKNIDCQKMLRTKVAQN